MVSIPIESVCLWDSGTPRVPVRTIYIRSSFLFHSRLHRSGAARCRPPNNDDLWRTWYMGLQQMTMSVSIIATPSPTQHTPDPSMDVQGSRPFLCS